MKKLILLGAFITSLATVPATFADSENYHGSNCVTDSFYDTRQNGGAGMEVSTKVYQEANFVCPLVSQEELENTPRKLRYARVVGSNIENARLCWRQAYVGGSTYCGNPKSFAGSGSTNLYPKFPSNNPLFADVHGAIWLISDVPRFSRSTIEMYSVKFKR